MVRAKKRRTLHVVFDTNSIFTSSIRELFKPSAAELLRQNNRHADVDIIWYVPEVVRQEREYQMREEAKKYLGGVDKLEKLVGFNWGVNVESIGSSVTKAVDTQFAELKVTVRQLDTTLVNWNALIDASAKRIPPFEKGEKEKGFRDAIVGETFMQLVGTLPTGTREQAVLVTGDALLTEAVKPRIQGTPNAKIIGDLEELQSTLNLLLSEVPPEFAQELVEKANVMFYVYGGPDTTMYYTQKVDETIKSKFPEQFSVIPPGAEKIGVVKSVMHTTNFVRKEGQRVYFVNRLIYELVATRLENARTPRIGEFGAVQAARNVLASALRNVVNVSNRTVTFDIHWSATLTQTKKLQRETIDDYQIAAINENILVTEDDLA